MIDIENAVETLLDADVTLAALLTGGIHAWKELPRNEINETQLPSAYTNGILKPLCVIRERITVPFGTVVDNSNQRRSVRTPLEIRLYVDGDAGFGTLQTAKERIYALLHKKPVAGAGNGRFTAEQPLHDFQLQNAAVYKLDYDIIGYRKV